MLILSRQPCVDPPPSAPPTTQPADIMNSYLLYLTGVFFVRAAKLRAWSA